jgi:hypothetical protein
MGREERMEVTNCRKLGVGVVDVSGEILRTILAAGWSTNGRALQCLQGIPKDAVFTGASFYPLRGSVRLYYRSAEISYQDGRAYQTVVEMRKVDVVSPMAEQIIGEVESLRDNFAAGIRPGWWARITRRNVGTEAQVRALSVTAGYLRSRFGIVKAKPAERPTPAQACPAGEAAHPGAAQ